MEKTRENDALIYELISLLTKGNAHVTFNDATADIPFEDLGKKPAGLPYSIWQLTEHIRIALKDILDFSANNNYVALNWPDDYWPAEDAPLNVTEWQKSLQQINRDLDAYIALLENSDNIYKHFEYGSGQSLLRQAMLIADHNSYHTGQIMLVRKLLGNWQG